MRRTSYFFNVTDPMGHERQIRVLAYSPEGAFLLLERRGYTNIERVAKPRRQATAAPRPTATVNRRALNEAIEMLGIKFPVEVKMTGHVGPRRGAHRITPTGSGIEVRGAKVWGLKGHTVESAKFVHRITVKNYLDAEQMGRTLWHELTHAMQFERDAASDPQGDATAAVRGWATAYRDGTSYDRKPAEVEARSYEPFNDDLPLAR